MLCYKNATLTRSPCPGVILGTSVVPKFFAFNNVIKLVENLPNVKRLYKNSVLTTTLENKLKYFKYFKGLYQCKR